MISGPDGKPLRATILDFKTDRVENEMESTRTAERYRPQIETYRTALAQLLGLPASSINAILLFTRIALALELSAE